MSKRTILMLTMTTFGLLALAPLLNPAWAAQEAAAGGGTSSQLATFGAVIALGFAAAFCGLGQAWAISASCSGIARNPGAAGAIRMAMLLGLAFIESLVIYVLVVVFMKG